MVFICLIKSQVQELSIKTDNKIATAHNNIAFLYLQKRQFEEARIHISRAYELDSSDEVIRTNYIEMVDFIEKDKKNAIFEQFNLKILEPKFEDILSISSIPSIPLTIPVSEIWSLDF